MAAVVFELDHEETFPTRRAELYRKFVKILLEDEEAARETRASFRLEWDKRYGAQGEESADRLLNHRLALLEYLALWKQAGNTGSLTNESVNYIIRQNLVEAEVDRDWLTQQIAIVLRRAGLLNWHGGKPVFVHNTFAEYLAASALGRSCIPDYDSTLQIIDQWTEETWREVVLFLLGIWSSKGERVDRYLTHITDSGGSDGFVFAASALADGVLVSPLTTDKIVFGLLKSSKNLRVTDLPRHPHALDALIRLLDREFVIDGLVGLARNSVVEIYIKAEVLRLLETNGYKKEALEGWVFIAKAEPRKTGPIERAITSIKRLGGFHELLTIGFDTSYHPRHRVFALRNAAQLNPSDEVKEGLRYVAYSTRCNSHYRIEAAHELAGLLPPEEMAQVWQNLANDRSIPPMTRLLIARALANTGLSDRAKAIVLELVLDTDLSASVLSEIAKQGKKFLSEAELTQIWHSLTSEASLSSTPEKRLIVGRGLRQAGLTTESNSVLMPLLHDKSANGMTRLRAAELLNTFFSPEEIGRIWLDLANDKSFTIKVRLQVANELKQFKLVGTAALLFLSITNDSTAASTQRIKAALSLQLICGSKLMKAVWNNLATDADIWEGDQDRAVLEFQRDELLDGIDGQWSVSGETGSSLRPFALASEVVNQINIPAELRGWFAAVLANDVKVLSEKAESVTDAHEESLAEQDLSDMDAGKLGLMAQNSNFPLKTRIKLAREVQKRGTTDQAIDAWFSIAYEPAVTTADRLLIAREILQSELLEEDAMGILLDLIRDDSIASELRIQSINTLKDFGRSQKLTEVANDLTVDRDLRKHAIKIMGHINEIDVLRLLRHIANAHPEKEMRRLARHAAKRIEDRQIA